MSFLRPTIPDARGRTVTLPLSVGIRPARLRHRLWKQTLSLDIERKARTLTLAEENAVRRGAFKGYGLISTVAAPLICNLPFWITFPYLGRVPTATYLTVNAVALMILLLVLFPLGGWIVWRTAPRLIHEAFARRVIACGFCPSCGYVLAAIRPQPDGVVQCPECSASWRTEPPTVSPVG